MALYTEISLTVDATIAEATVIIEAVYEAVREKLEELGVGEIVEAEFGVE